MATDPIQTSRKRQISLLLAPELIDFADRQAKARFTTRNEYITALLVEAYSGTRPS